MRNKKIIFHVTRQYMKRNRRRTISTLLGIMLMVVLMTCVFVGKDTAINYLREVAEAKSGSWHVSVYDADEKQYEQIKNLDDIGETAISYDMGFSECKESKNKEKPYWELKAYSESCFDWMNIKLVKGRFPQNKGEVVISQNALKDGSNLKIGDTISFSAFKRKIRGLNPDFKTTFPYYNLTVAYNETIEIPQEFPFYGENNSFEEIHEETGFSDTYKIVGIIKAPAYEKKDTAFYSALAYTKERPENGMHVNVTCKLAKNAGSDYGYFSEIEKIMGGDSDSYEVNDLVLAFSAQTSDSTLNWMINAIIIFFLIFILVISMILIYNVYNISYEERSRYLGMLSSIGATKHQKCSSVYYESLFLLMLALPAGILAGFGVVKAGMMVLKPHITEIEGAFIASNAIPENVHLVITPLNLLMVIGAGIFTVFVSSLLPARKIAKTGPIESIRGNQTSKKKHYRSGKWLMKKGNPEALLASRHLHRQTYKSGSIVRSVAIFMIVLMVTTYGTDIITKMVHYRLVEDYDLSENLKGYDYTIIEKMPEEQNAAKDEKTNMYDAMKEEIQKDPAVKEVKEWYEDMFTLSFDANILSESYKKAYREIAGEYYHKKLTEEEFVKIMDIEATGGKWNQGMGILAVDEETFQDIAKKSGSSKQVINSAECPGILYRSAELSTKNISFNEEKPDHYRMYEIDKVCDLKAGDKFPVSYYHEEKEKLENYDITIAGYADSEAVKDYVSFHGERIWMIIPADMPKVLKPVFQGQRELHISLSDRNSNLAQKLQSMCMQEYDDYMVLEAGNQQLQSIAETLNYMIKVLAVAFVLFTAMICLLNLYNSIRARAVSRKREMAMLRSVGMEEKQMNKMLFYENIGIWLRGFIWSAVISIPIMYGMAKVLKDQFGEITTEVNGLIVLVAVVITVFSLIFITKICYHGKDSDNLLEEMRREDV